MADFNVEFLESNQSFTLTFGDSSESFAAGFDNIVEVTTAPVYTGSYHVTPSQSTQVLSTNGKMMTSNITIDPIPSNYGRISYDGAELTVF